MVLIFVFSSRPGDESAEDSSWVSMLVGEVFVPGFDEWSQAEQEAFAARIDHPVRKTAHATEYAVLALLAAGAFIDRKTGIRAGIVVPCLAAVRTVIRKRSVNRRQTEYVTARKGENGRSGS